MIRQLFLVVIVGALMWWLRKFTRKMQPPQQGRPVDGRPGTQPIRDLGPMVRDHVCNTFLPKSRALTARVDSDELYFCSEECREKFRAKHTVHSA